MRNPLASIEPKSVERIAEWLERNVYLSPRVPTVAPGQWNRRSVPALTAKGGLFDVLDDPGTETVVVCKGSQTALTTSAYCWLVSECCNDPGSALIVMNSTQDARDKSSESWRPIWEDSPKLKDYLPQCRRKDWTKLYQMVNRSPVYWMGANSAGRLGSKPIRRLILDEVDKYPERFGGGRGSTSEGPREAGACALAEQRVKTFRGTGLAKILKFSTPTVDTGEIWRAYEQGDQRKLYVRCHACNGEQVMTWQDFRIDMDLAKTDPGAAVAGAHYECRHCKAPWTDGQRIAAIERGEWKPTATPRDPLCVSFHLPSWLSAFVNCQYLAAQWIKAQSGQGPLQDFVNSECGEPYHHYELRLRSEAFVALEGDYAEGAKLEGGFVICGCDVQKGYLVPVFRWFNETGDSKLIWAGSVNNLERLDELCAEHDAKYIMIDQRYRQREIQEWAFAHAGYIPCYGLTTRARSIFSVGAIDLDEGKSTKTGVRVVEVVAFDADQVKDIVADCVGRRQGAREWRVPAGYAANTEYCKQMTVERSVNGRWVNPGKRDNHYWDAECLAMLGAIRFGLWGNYAVSHADDPT